MKVFFYFFILNSYVIKKRKKNWLKNFNCKCLDCDYNQNCVVRWHITINCEWCVVCWAGSGFAYTRGLYYCHFDMCHCHMDINYWHIDICRCHCVTFWGNINNCYCQKETCHNNNLWYRHIDMSLPHNHMSLSYWHVSMSHIHKLLTQRLKTYVAVTVWQSYFHIDTFHCNIDGCHWQKDACHKYKYSSYTQIDT